MATQILQWNANSLIAHEAEFKNFVAETSPEIICVQETFLKSKHRFSIVGYTIERKDRDDATRGGGVAIFIKSGTKYTVVQTPPNIEALKVKLEKPKISVTNIYNPPNSKIDPNFLQSICEKNTIICGDFNSKHTMWGHYTCDENGKAINDLVENYGNVVPQHGSRNPYYQTGRLFPNRSHAMFYEPGSQVRMGSPRKLLGERPSTSRHSNKLPSGQRRKPDREMDLEKSRLAEPEKRQPKPHPRRTHIK